MKHDARTVARALAAARVRALADSPSALRVVADEVAYREELERIAHRIEAHRPRRRGKPVTRR